MESKFEIGYDTNNQQVVFKADTSFYNSSWFQQIYRLLLDRTDEIEISITGKIIAPWWAFLTSKKEIGAILKINNIQFNLSQEAEYYLNISKKFEESYNLNQLPADVSFDEIKTKLISKGWNWESRPLTDHQTRNIQKLVKFFASATFSVPGAGKTTEALAFFALKTDQNDKLLIICPKNAFISWDEQLSLCFTDQTKKFSRLCGGIDNISKLLDMSEKYQIITYQQFTRVQNVIADFLVKNKVFVFLDESHRIKSGRGYITADSILRIAHLTSGKLIMSGTPMPQSTNDLLPQYEFLYPEVRATSENIVEKIQPIFVRTTKAELNLPPVKRHKIEIPLNPIQEYLYLLMKDEVARQAEATLTAANRIAFRRLGKSVIRLIELVSNPLLLLGDMQFINDKLLGEVISEGSSPKLLYACERARQLAKSNRKCIIWTTFRNNVESIAERLSDLNAVYIHGGIDTGDDDNIDTREGRIKKFKEDDSCFVLVANPAAASESISLHFVCHNAMYVDRTYNAAHYLQSEDRIHRLGLLPDQITNIEILISPDTIDEHIDERLKDKVVRMAAALDDKSLSIETIPYDIGDNPEDDSANLDYEDIKGLLEWLRRK